MLLRMMVMKSLVPIKDPVEMLRHCFSGGVGIVVSYCGENGAMVVDQ